jgi:hypothetical protein
MANIREALIEQQAEKFRASFPDRTVRVFRVFIEPYFPIGTKYFYQPDEFTAIINGKKETTRPDLKIVRPDGKKIIRMEFTKGKRNGTDPKEREKEIMKQAAPNDIFVALYCNNLKRMQMKFRDEGLNLFKDEKKKKYKNKPLKSAPQPIKNPHTSKSKRMMNVSLGQARKISGRLVVRSR